MSRKNRNARRPVNGKAIQLHIDNIQSQHDVFMLDDKCGFEYTRLSSAVLESSIGYQRRLNPDRVQRIVDNFDPRVVNPLKVSARDGHFYVFDGAHTLAALKQIHKFDNFMVQCMLFHGLTFEDEAYLFSLQRGESKEVATGERLRAQFLAKRPDAEEMLRRTEEAGFQLVFHHSGANGKLSCLAKLWKIYSASPERYTETLAILRDAWHGEAWSLTANIVGGLALFIQVYWDGFSRTRLLKQIQDADARMLKLLCDNTSPNKDYAYAFALLKLYNRIGGKGTLMPYDLYDYKF